MYYLLVETGWSGTLQESDKTNNVKHGPLTITVPLLPDLQTGTVGPDGGLRGRYDRRHLAGEKQRLQIHLAQLAGLHLSLAGQRLFRKATLPCSAHSISIVPSLNLMPDSTYTGHHQRTAPLPGLRNAVDTCGRGRRQPGI